MTAKWTSIKTDYGNINLLRMKTPLGWLIRSEDGQTLTHFEDPAGLWAEIQNIKFQIIPSSGVETMLKRARVPGGWILLKTQTTQKRTHNGDQLKLKFSSLLFVHDPDGHWLL